MAEDSNRRVILVSVDISRKTAGLDSALSDQSRVFESWNVEPFEIAT